MKTKIENNYIKHVCDGDFEFSYKDFVFTFSLDDLIGSVKIQKDIGPVEDLFYSMVSWNAVCYSEKIHDELLEIKEDIKNNFKKVTKI